MSKTDQSIDLQMLDEISLRRPDFQQDIPIVLADGQTWHLRRPIVEFRMRFDDLDDVSFAKKVSGFGERYMDLLERWYDLEGAAAINMMGKMACLLFRLNYDLDNEALSSLLPIIPGEPANIAMWNKIAGVAKGEPDPIVGPEDDGFD